MTKQKSQNEVRAATELDADSLSLLASSTFIESYDDLSPEESKDPWSDTYCYKEPMHPSQFQCSTSLSAFGFL
jgi:hypothetical protein